MDDLERLGRFAMAPDVHLGEEALVRGWITEEQLDECLKERAAHPELPLGAILVRRRLITSEQLAELLRSHVTLQCATCRSNFHVRAGSMEQTPRCPRCRSELVRELAFESVPATPADLPEEVRAMRTNPANCFGKFVKVHRVGEGGMGAVWKCFDLALRRWVAVKFIEGQSEEIAAKVMREAQAAAKLQHPGMVQVHEVGRWGNLNAIVMEYVEGKTLDQLRLDMREALRHIRDAARAVDHAHKNGIIHGNLKPSNILVSKDGRVYVADFGLAKELGVHSRTGHLVGTPSYMSPEQARGQQVDARTDVYSLGAALYKLVTGLPPFQGEGMMDTLENVIHQEPVPPRGVDRDVRIIIMKTLEKDPTRRYPTAADLADDIDRYLNGEPVLARPPSVTYRVTKKLAKHRIVAALTVVIVVSIAAFLVTRESEHAERDRRVSTAMNAIGEFERRAQHVASPEAYRQLRIIHLDAALREIDEGLKRREHPKLRVVRARALWAVRDADGALAELARALQQDPSSTEAHLLRGRILTEQYQALCASRPSFGVVGSELVRIPAAEPEAARPIREAALESLRKVQSPGATPAERADALLARAIVEYYEGRYADMVGSIDQAARLRNYEDYDSHFYRGLAYRYLDKLDLSVKELEAAVELHPFCAAAHQQYIIALQTQALTSDAIDPLRRAEAAVERALALGIETGKMRSYRAFHGVIRMQRAVAKGEPDAGRAVDEAVERCREHGDADYLVLALVQKIRMKLERNEDPTAELNECLKLLDKAAAPSEVAQRGSLYHTRALWNARRGLDPLKDFEASLADLGRAIELAPSDPEKAMMLRERSGVRRSLAKYRVALSQDPLPELDDAVQDLTAAARLVLDRRTLAERGDLHMERARYLNIQNQDARPAWRSGIEDFDALESMAAGDDRLLRAIAENRALAWYQIAHADARAGLDPSEALVRVVREAEKWSALDPRNFGPNEVAAAAYNNLGYQLHVRGKDPTEHYRKAIDAYSRAIALADAAPLYLARGQTWANLGQWLNSKEEFKRAVEDWEAAIQKMPQLETELRDKIKDARVRAGH